MNSARRMMFGFTIASLFGLWSGIAAADVTKIIEGCSNCHGKDGVSTEPEIPTIAGFSPQYLSDNLGAYKNKQRTCVEVKYPAGPKKGQATDMCRVTKELSDADASALAKHFSGKKFGRAKQEFDAAKAAKGKKLHEMSCEKCHSEGGTVPDEDAGILAGQWKHYLEHTFKEFTSGKREMPKKMKPKVEKLSPDDITALISYYASQQ